MSRPVALSIRQPWAWLVAHGHKDVENRSWYSQFRGRFLIHASSGMTKTQYRDCQATLDSIGKKIILPPFEALERGGIVGEAEVVDCVTCYDSSWFFGPYGYVLRNQAPFPLHPCRGFLGFFPIDFDLRRKVLGE